MERIKLLNTYVDNLTINETVDRVEQYIIHNKSLHLMGVNADKINEINRNSRLREIVNSCDVINADGTSVVWAARVLGSPLKERVAGVDLMHALLSLSEEKGYNVYFLGAKQDVVEDMVSNFREVFPKLNVVGYRNGYFSKDEWNQVKDEIIESKAQIVFVGISSPLKEYLIEYFMENDASAVYMGVGGSFDVFSGRIPRAPKFIQKCGFEWLFRMIQEPRRLAKRYLVGNSKFIWLVYKEKFERMRK